MRELFIVTASYDDNAGLWSAEANDLGGLFLQATSWRTLVETVPDAVGRLLPSGLFRPARDIAIEVAEGADTRRRTIR